MHMTFKEITLWLGLYALDVTATVQKLIYEAILLKIQILKQVGQN